jgi:hypothetical protein
MRLAYLSRPVALFSAVSLVGALLAASSSVRAQQQQAPVYVPAPPPTYAPAPPPAPYGTAPSPYAPASPGYDTSGAPGGVYGAPYAPARPRVIKDWNDGDPVPAGYHVGTRVRVAPIAVGASMFGVAWLSSALGASVANGLGNDASDLFIPAIGPFLQMSKTTDATGNFWNVFDGTVQCVGIGLLIYGIVSPQQVLVRNDVARWLPTPYAARNGGGLVWGGAF